jgi:hypothetical protein
MTIAEAWDVIDAAGDIGHAHGYECYPTVARCYLELDFVRGDNVFAAVITGADLNACADFAAVRELVERRVAEAFVARGVARRANA